MSSIAIVGDVVEHVVITDAERTSEGDGPAFNKAAIKLLAEFNKAVGEQDAGRAVDYHLVMVAESVEAPVQVTEEVHENECIKTRQVCGGPCTCGGGPRVRVVDRTERARRPTEILKKPSGKGACRDGTCPGVRLTPRKEG